MAAPHRAPPQQKVASRSIVLVEACPVQAALSQAIVPVPAPRCCLEQRRSFTVYAICVGILSVLRLPHVHSAPRVLQPTGHCLAMPDFPHRRNYGPHARLPAIIAACIAAPSVHVVQWSRTASGDPRLRDPGNLSLQLPSPKPPASGGDDSPRHTLRDVWAALDGGIMQPRRTWCAAGVVYLPHPHLALARPCGGTSMRHAPPN
ncbi:hypothetical protein C8R47DRAFT_1223624 [Mycena vitilis]|nr:hypothetical protein C8R47DRAFT_1223624 [Mycena vitilis]